MNNSILYTVNKSNNEFRVVVNAISDWTGFEKLVKYLEVNFQASVIHSYDGPDARRWIFSIDGIEIELIHSDGYGNYLHSTTEQGQSLIKKIGADLELRLKSL